ncbi:hypothetical protein DEI92_03965 [Curtobacterium sp. MCBD17_034]|uniref:hypothetical protein n=1 Tax=unclassified Curtobacterium TaxID=257496 RepID=UPI000DA7F0B0|nr:MULTISPECIES: hypothetical protein [unclassified Curtobacterium]PZE75825.1 hypothetical protein DEI82_07995 [Curtobacterium sp. MCBD17_019]PZF60813.1 hypothetical protein DEI92_03965 [Curtobacterium sp. MCBD17_034]PZM40162.1 hypothetical protein DEI90_00200 [Curtobacterium sp. MCBD17_031]
MPPIRSQRSAPTLDALRADVRAEFGPAARIVAAERVTTGGIGGLFRKHHYEATVEVPAPGDEPVARVAIDAGGPRRAGILALLEDAEAREDRLAAADAVTTRRGRRAAEEARGSLRPVPGVPASGRSVSSGAGPAGPLLVGADEEVVATRSDAFASLMDDFTFNGLAPRVPLGEALGGAGTATPAVGPAVPLPSDREDRLVESTPLTPVAAGVDGFVRAPVPDATDRIPDPPAVRRADGDLVLVVGRSAAVTEVLPVVATAHALRILPVEDRRSAILARAAGVQEGTAVVSSFVWSGAADDPERAARLVGIAPDQVWVVVDAGRKHDDTAREVRAVQRTIGVTGVLSVGAEDTTTPETVHMLGFPVVDVRSWR